MTRLLSSVLLLFLLSTLSASGSGAAVSSPAYLRVVEGDVVVVPADTGRPETAYETAPLSAGDRVRVARDARLEIVMGDDSRLRVDAESELELVAAGAASETGREGGVVRLDEGVVQVDTAGPSDGRERLRIDTRQASVFLEPAGSYYLELTPAGALYILARSGWAEVVTVDGSSLVREDEAGELGAGRSGRMTVTPAPAELAAIEKWASRLAADAAAVEAAHVAPRLRYRALPLARHGVWIETGTGWAWRPRVAADWRPYWHGYWLPRPSGMFWVSYEPWGWVPYHYGSWSHHARYGWIWHPGTVYAPAHVYWYWGPTHAAWVPIGYYHHHYRHRWGSGIDLHFGVHGYARADWRAYGHWVFCPRTSLGLAHQYRFHADSRRVAHHSGFRTIPRGVISADTRGLTRSHWRRPGSVEAVLGRRARDRNGAHTALPDVSAFVRREADLPRGVRARLLSGPVETAAPLRTVRPRGQEATVRSRSRRSSDRLLPAASGSRRVQDRNVVAKRPDRFRTRSLDRGGRAATVRPRRSERAPILRVIEGVRSRSVPSATALHRRESSRRSTAHRSLAARSPTLARPHIARRSPTRAPERANRASNEHRARPRSVSRGSVSRGSVSRGSVSRGSVSRAPVSRRAPSRAPSSRSSAAPATRDRGRASASAARSGSASRPRSAARSSARSGAARPGRSRSARHR